MIIHLENLVSLSIVKDHIGSQKVDDNGYNKLIKIYAEDK